MLELRMMMVMNQRDKIKRYLGQRFDVTIKPCFWETSMFEGFTDNSLIIEVFS